MIDEINSILVGSARQQRYFLPVVAVPVERAAGRYRLCRSAGGTLCPALRPATAQPGCRHRAGALDRRAGASGLRHHAGSRPAAATALPGSTARSCGACSLPGPAASPCRFAGRWSGRVLPRYATARSALTWLPLKIPQSGEASNRPLTPWGDCVLRRSPAVRRERHGVPRLPLAPPAMPDEAPSSWLARIAARYDVSAEGLIRHLLPSEADVSGMIRRVDHVVVPALEAALAEATARPACNFVGRRLAGLSANQPAAWPRSNPAWCPVCAAHDVAAHGEVYSRAAWGFGGLLLCPRHQCLLISVCPRCYRRVGYHPINGRLRIWCWTCGADADNALAPDRIPFWPYGTPQQNRRCVTISLSSETRPLLLRVQTDLVAMLAGARPGAPGQGPSNGRWSSPCCAR